MKILLAILIVLVGIPVLFAVPILIARLINVPADIVLFGTAAIVVLILLITAVYNILTIYYD